MTRLGPLRDRADVELGFTATCEPGDVVISIVRLGIGVPPQKRDADHVQRHATVTRASCIPLAVLPVLPRAGRLWWGCSPIPLQREKAQVLRAEGSASGVISKENLYVAPDHVWSCSGAECGRHLLLQLQDGRPSRV